MKIKLAYGKTSLRVDVPDAATVIRQNEQPEIEDLANRLFQSFESPINQPSLCYQYKPGMQVAVVHTDLTRATPNQLILPILLSYLIEHGVAREDITLVNALGTHRQQTPDEMVDLLGEAIIHEFRCVQHDCHNPNAMVIVGQSKDGVPVAINRLVAEAGLRILTGLIEPHFFAGFSGGPKAILPGVAGVETIHNNHGYGRIAHPSAKFGETCENPIYREMLAAAELLEPSLLLNVAMNPQGGITKIFTGDIHAAHQRGCAYVKQHAMRAVLNRFDVVVTTNGGYPLDQNLYQSIKGLSAAHQIVRKGGAILLISRCVDGLPDHGGYADLLRSGRSASEILEALAHQEKIIPDQWQFQIQARILADAEVHVYSEGLTDQEIQIAFFQPCRSINRTLSKLLAKHGDRICILPDGPYSIPYIQ